MKLVVGLGNPGGQYECTRHNVGFMVVDEFARRLNVTSFKERHRALIGECKHEGETLLLVKPLTYMNLSGEAVGEIARWYKIEPEDIIVIFDDLDLDVGRLRIRIKGSSGGHRGIESLLVHLGVDSFPRFRIGIGRPPEGFTVPNYVLSRFKEDEEKNINEAIDKACNALIVATKEGVTKAMNQFNK